MIFFKWRELSEYPSGTQTCANRPWAGPRWHMRKPRLSNISKHACMIVLCFSNHFNDIWHLTRTWPTLPPFFADSSLMPRRLFGNSSLIIHEFCTGSSQILGRPFVDSSPIHRRLFPDSSPIMFPNLRRIFGDPSLNLRLFFTSSSLVLPRLFADHSTIQHRDTPPPQHTHTQTPTPTPTPHTPYQPELNPCRFAEYTNTGQPTIVARFATTE
jgi:hypothetical protein